MMKFKKFLAVAMAAVMTLSFAGQVMAADGSWQKNNTGWWYRYSNGTWPTSEWLLDNDGSWYHFDSDGYMQTGYQTIGSYTYEFNASGAMIANNVSMDNIDAEFVTAINNKRTAAGVGAIAVDDALMQAADIRTATLSEDIINQSKKPRTGDEYSASAIKEAGASVNSSTEIILTCDNSAEAIVSAMYGSTYQKDKILNAGYTKMGFSFAPVNGTGVWVLILAN